MRLGKVYISAHYVVDLDDESMVDDAKISFYEDLMNAIKHDEIQHWIDVKEDSSLSAENIPEFLKGE